MTKIEWSNISWNPISGCTPISTGCKNCYAKRMSKRLAGRFGYPKDDPFKVKLRYERLHQPMEWKKPAMIFVGSMGDLFHEEIPFSYIYKVFKVIAKNPQHIFQILTKRSKRLLIFQSFCTQEYYREQEGINRRNNKWFAEPRNHNLPRYYPPPYKTFKIDLPLSNLWLGTSVEDSKTKSRIDILRKVPAMVRFISFEPLLEDIGEINLKNIHWVIVGGESGPKARLINEDWVRSIRNQCLEFNVPFFYKQKMEGRKKINMPELDGKVWNQFPDMER